MPQFHCFGPYWESVVELVREQRIGQLSEVQLAEGAHWVDILSEDISGQVWDLFRVKLVSRQHIKVEDMEQCENQPTTWELPTRQQKCIISGNIVMYCGNVWLLPTDYVPPHLSIYGDLFCLWIPPGKHEKKNDYRLLKRHSFYY